MERKIRDISILVNTKINTLCLNNYTYISTENLIPNFGGITKASSIPLGNVTEFKIGDTLLSNIRPYFKKIYYAKFHGGCSNDVLVIRPKNVLDKYLFYALNNEDFIKYYVASCKGTKMPRGNKDALLDWTINVPSIQEQQHIVNTIGSLDDLIENYQKRVSKTCDLLSISLKKYQNKTTIDFYNPKIIKSGITTFDKTKVYTDTSIIEGINNMSDGEVITFNNRPSRANMQPIKNSIWFAKMKDSNKKLIITNNDLDLIDNYILSTGYLGVEASSKLPLSLLSAMIISSDFNEQRDLNSVGTTMAGINNETFLKILVPKLSDEDIFEFDKKYSCYIDELSLLRKKINSLKSIKFNLLDKYF